DNDHGVHLCTLVQVLGAHGWGALPVPARPHHGSAREPAARSGRQLSATRGRAPAAVLGSKSIREQRGRAVTREVRLGIVGYGAQGSVYARMLAGGQVPGMALGAIADRNEARREVGARARPDTPLHAGPGGLVAS